MRSGRRSGKFARASLGEEWATISLDVLNMLSLDHSYRFDHSYTLSVFRN